MTVVLYFSLSSMTVQFCIYFLQLVATRPIHVGTCCSSLWNYSNRFVNMASRLWKQKWFQKIQYFYSCLYFQWAVYNIIYKYIFHVRIWVDSSWPDIGRRFILSCYWFSHNLSLIGLVAHRTRLWDSCLYQVQMGWETLQSSVIHERFAVLAAVVQLLSPVRLFATL